MKRVSAALIFGLLVSLFCHAQVQTGNASYNSSKAGQTISHPSLSFNTRVKVTNLRNNMSTEAVVNGRIEISSTRIADIAHSVGDTLQMSKTGMTPVQIEVLHPEPAQGEPAQAAPVQTAPARAAQPAPVQQSTPAQQPASRPAAARTSSPPAAAAQPASEAAVQTVPQPDQPVPVETLTEIRYVPVSAACPGMICLVVLILLILVIVLLVIILILLLRFRSWPWYYPIWLRRHFRYTKRRL